MSDDIIPFQRARWNALAAANIEYSRPFLDLEPAAARRWLDPQGMLGEVRDRPVLILGGGGGQQSAAFGLLAAAVTVFDLSDEQLARDRVAADRHGYAVRLEQGDMRDLSRFAPNSFDLVYHAYSIDFVPDAAPVFDQVVRVLRPGGRYRIEFSNPYTKGADDSSWDGTGYRCRLPYVTGPIDFGDPHWDVSQEDGSTQRVAGPHEYRHRLSDVINGLISRGFMLLGLWESEVGDPHAAPGSWEHFKAYLPPYLTLWARLEEEGTGQ